MSESFAPPVSRKSRLPENLAAASIENSVASVSLSTICKAASDPLRLDILRILSRGSFGVQELANILAVPQPGMSHHLKILFRGGLVVTRRQGNSIFYRRALLKNSLGLDFFRQSLYRAVDEFPLAKAYAQKMNAVEKERSQQSKQYFKKNVDKFQESQGMLCELGQYFPNLKELLDLMVVPKNARALEVGPGQGELLEELAQRFDHLTALDSSPEMLSFTRDRVKRKNKIEFVNASLETYSVQSAPFHAVVLNMVMHHLASPAKSFLNLKNIVEKNGYLLMADLCSHDQEWTRESCGDVWLGFDPQDVTDWAKSAGFEEKQSSYLGLKNGFQIQLKLFRKL